METRTFNPATAPKACPSLALMLAYGTIPTNPRMPGTREDETFFEITDAIERLVPMGFTKTDVLDAMQYFVKEGFMRFTPDEDAFMKGEGYEGNPEA